MCKEIKIRTTRYIGHMSWFVNNKTERKNTCMLINIIVGQSDCKNFNEPALYYSKRNCDDTIWVLVTSSAWDAYSVCRVLCNPIITSCLYLRLWITDKLATKERVVCSLIWLSAIELDRSSEESLHKIKGCHADLIFSKEQSAKSRNSTAVSFE